MDAKLLRLREGIQLSYDLPHHVYATCVYPRQSSNGSTVIIYAHDNGVRAVWYGGTNLKTKVSDRTNGEIIDLAADDDVAMEYEDDQAEVDPARPFQDVVTHLDIPLGSTAISIGVPPVTQETDSGLPQMLNTYAIVLVACVDLSLRLVAVPLDPQKDMQSRVKQITIGGSNSHQELVSGVAVTITATVAEGDNSQSEQTSSRTRTRNLDASEDFDPGREWSFLLASTSATGNGLLLIHQIPLNLNGDFSSNVDDHVPIQRTFLRCPLTACRLAFNTALYPSQRHSSLLVASKDGAATKVYQALPQSNSSRKRRGSTTTVDSNTSGTQTSRRSSHNDRSQINLLAPFRSVRVYGLTPQRKRILDADWILHGRAILVLLEDGEWGIWDLEAAAPSGTTTSRNLVKGQASVSGIQGASLTRFALRGNVRMGVVAVRKSGTQDSETATRSSLAPMTPHTRKTRSEGLFNDKQQTPALDAPLQSKVVSGSLAVSAQPKVGQRMQQESVVFNYDGVSILIPSIEAYWRSEIGGRGSFDESASSRPVIFPTLQTAGEKQKSVHLMPQASKQMGAGMHVSTKHLQNYLVSTTSRLILFVVPQTESSITSQSVTIPMRPLTGSAVDKDQVLLDSGELDVDGMERILDSMANSATLSTSTTAAVPNGTYGKSVGFGYDSNGNVDVDMETPTAQRSSKSKLVINKTTDQSERPKRLFT